MRLLFPSVSVSPLFLVGTCIAALAQTAPVEKQINGRPGEEIRIGVFASVQKDCKAGALPSVKLQKSPENGSVAVKEGRVRATNLKECLAIEVPAFIAFYKSKPDFEGEDQVILQIVDATGKAQSHAIRLRISRSQTDRPSDKKAPAKRDNNNI